MLIDRGRLVCIGKVLEPHGLHGEMKVRPLTDAPAHYEECAAVILDGGAGLRTYSVRRIRAAGRQWIFALEGIGDREAAQRLRGAEVLVDETEVKPLESGEYFLDDLIGCEVVDQGGKRLGVVDGLIETGANDVLEVRTAYGETLVPMTDEVVSEVDMEARRIRITPLPGLFDGDAR